MPPPEQPGGLAKGLTGAAAALAPALPAVAGKTNHLAGICVSGTGATGASTITITVTGLEGGTITFFLVIPAGAALGFEPLIVAFDREIPASGINTAITLNVPSFGAGNLNAAAIIWGYAE